MPVTPVNTRGNAYFRLTSLNTTNPNNVKSSGGVLFTIAAINTGSLAYLKLYDESTAPTVGTDAVAFTVPLPGSSAVTNITIPDGARFLNGIGIGLTANLADSDTTAVSANAIVLTLFYS